MSTAFKRLLGHYSTFYFAWAVDNKLLVALRAISTQQAQATVAKEQAVQLILDYVDTYPNDGTVNWASNMILYTHADKDSWRCSNILCMYDMDVVCIFKVLQSQPWRSSIMVYTLRCPRIPANSPKSGETSVVVTVWVCNHMLIHISWRCLKHLMCAWYRNGMQFERFYSLNHSIAAMNTHIHNLGFCPTHSNLGKHLWR